MRYLLENEKCKVEVESLGAELKSFVKKENSQEYMWSGDPEIWGKVSPLLFPFIGKLKDFKYTYKDSEYEIMKHGFVKETEFTIAETGKDRICFETSDTEDTRSMYPFSFRLVVEYRLEGLTLSENWRVYNTGKDTLYFSIGGHPGFLCPPADVEGQSGDRTSCALKLYGCKGDSFQNLCVGSDGLLSGKEISISMEQGILPVTEHIFDDDALILQEQGVWGVGLCDRNGREYVRAEADVPVWGIWSVADSKAPYICLEPWFGICDKTDFAGTLEERPLMCSVEPEEVWENGYRIVIGE